jgi:hypothetical protein
MTPPSPTSVPTSEGCNCWNCRFLLPAFRDLVVRLVVEVDEAEGSYGIDPVLFRQAIDLLDGKVSSSST